MTKETLFKKMQAQNIFWSYAAETSKDIPDSVFIEHILIYADVDEIKVLFKVFSKEEIKRVWDEKMVPDSRYRRVNYYLAKFFFEIEDIEQYLTKKSLLYSRYEKLKRLSSKY